MAQKNEAGIARITALLDRRDRCIKSLLRTLEHLDRERQFAVLTSYLSIDDLERLTRFQEVHSR